ncbi:MAG: hypothetical protein ABR552_01980, partial [Actinomycetota bacterium]
QRAMRALGLSSDPSAPSSLRWSGIFGMLADSSATPPALWSTAVDGTGTMGSLDLAIGDMITTFDERDFAPAFGSAADGVAAMSDPLAWLHGSAMTTGD